MSANLSLNLAEENREQLISFFKQVRSASEQLAKPLTDEDQTVQSMPDASPTKWHLAHTSWFFETFVLEEFQANFEPFNRDYRVLFNSYYNAVGPQYTRAHRGQITRPGATEVLAYRQSVDQRIAQLLENCSSDSYAKIFPVVVLGLNHEQQHQELIVTDIKHAFSYNPLYPSISHVNEVSTQIESPNWAKFESGIYQIGYTGDAFHFDNEGPEHRVFQEAFSIASRPVTNGEYIEFIQASGYQAPKYWLSEGWAWVQSEQIDAPLYWKKQEDGWYQYSLGGFRKVALNEAVTHISYFEAEAYASWAGKRLPTEVEWEIAAKLEADSDEGIQGHFIDPNRLHPNVVRNSMFGDVWIWTSSAYSGYPGYKVPDGAIGEYNGKFMSNQYVLRGGSCATPEGHIRASYRNFFPAATRWQFSGIRLAVSAD